MGMFEGFSRKKIKVKTEHEDVKKLRDMHEHISEMSKQNNTKGIQAFNILAIPVDDESCEGFETSLGVIGDRRAMEAIFTKLAEINPDIAELINNVHAAMNGGTRTSGNSRDRAKDFMDDLMNNVNLPDGVKIKGVDMTDKTPGHLEDLMKDIMKDMKPKGPNTDIDRFNDDIESDD
tara:strand:+ start:74 stop:604 length:531 start_codon:yes stop_codon:yes gene_type:complete